MNCRLKCFFALQVTAFFLLHQNVRAAELIPIELEKLVLMTPEVSEVIQKLQLNEANISLLNAEEKPQLKFSTDGNYPISRNISSSSSRVATTSERYIDGKFIFETTLYDFGAQDEKIRAERERRKSLDLDLRSVKQNAVADLLQIASRRPYSFGYPTLGAPPVLYLGVPDLGVIRLWTSELATRCFGN